MKKLIHFLTTKTGRWLMTIIFGLCYLGILYLIISSKNEIAIIIGLFLIFIPSFPLTTFVPRSLFDLFGAVGFIFYFIARLIAAEICGIVIVPIRVGKYISNKISEKLK